MARPASRDPRAMRLRIRSQAAAAVALGSRSAAGTASRRLALEARMCARARLKTCPTSRRTYPRSHVSRVAAHPQGRVGDGAGDHATRKDEAAVDPDRMGEVYARALELMGPGRNDGASQQAEARQGYRLFWGRSGGRLLPGPAIHRRSVRNSRPAPLLRRGPGRRSGGFAAASLATPVRLDDGPLRCVCWICAARCRSSWMTRCRGALWSLAARSCCVSVAT